MTEGRTVPLSPEVVLSAWEHIDESGIAPDGLLFVGERGGRLASSTHGRVWAMARARAFTPEVAATPLAKRPYDPAPRVRVELAQRGRGAAARGHVGRAQPRGPDAGLREVH